MRLKPDQRIAVIITAAGRIAKEQGLSSVTHGATAKRCTVQTSANTVRHYFKDRDALWVAVIAANPELTEQGKELGIC